jgi:hypothetical protein
VPVSRADRFSHPTPDHIPTHRWHVTLAPPPVGKWRDGAEPEVCGDSMDVLPCGALVVLGPLPHRRVVHAWASGQWLSVAAVECGFQSLVTAAVNARADVSGVTDTMRGAPGSRMRADKCSEDTQFVPHPYCICECGYDTACAVHGGQR